MYQHRLIPCILLKNGLIVRSQGFKTHQIIGNPITTIARLSNWNVDELVVLDISSEDFHDRRREDHGVRYDGSTTIDVLHHIADACFMPLAFGGRIRTTDDIRERLAAGADKCVINSEAVRRPEFIEESARQFGSQCIVVSIDALRHADGALEVFTGGGREATGMTPADWAGRAERLGAGEIFLNSIDRDGTGSGYDIDLIRSVSEAVSIPVIACGGVGAYEHLPTAVIDGGASAAAAANIFHFFELSYPYAKKACLDAGLTMRGVGLGSKYFPREPVYDRASEDAAIEKRLERAKAGLGPARTIENAARVTWCSACVYPSSSASYLEMSEEGVCTGCQAGGDRKGFDKTELARRRDILETILENSRSRDGSRHDCVIGVSGGKDSYFQTHYIKNVMGLNPLLVTYYGNNFTDAGHRNLYRMKEVFDVDHIIVQPGVETLKKLNRLGFIVMGDMNWHGHVGIATNPMRIAVQNKIPLVIWGEHGETDISGQFSMNDFLEFTYRNRLEHEARNFEWTYMVGREGLTKQDLICWQYPSDQEIFNIGLRGIYLGNYIRWKSNEHLKFVIENYGFEVNDQPFERTYRTGSNLDDMHENGMHDYMKFIKFGYGRCTDHASKDIRTGDMSREKAVELVRKHDHIKSRDLNRWLEYVGMTEDEFDRIADTFRDPRVWRRVDGVWVKDNLWD
ncbi:MAG TPA: imidazole glycerol phosphate synthase subunit HisF [Rhodospirillales bacterium]|nr:imidazole glycerol phosphate synthase subunit HisF [Rhodospirillales bacterium]